MAASLEEAALASLAQAKRTLDELQAASVAHQDAYLRYIRDALDAGWGWKRTAAEIGVTPRAIQLYWEKHRQRAGRIGNAATETT